MGGAYFVFSHGLELDLKDVYLFWNNEVNPKGTGTRWIAHKLIGLNNSNDKYGRYDQHYGQHPENRQSYLCWNNNLKNTFNLLLSVALADLLEPDRELSSKIQELGQNSVGVLIKLNLITSGIEEFVKKNSKNSEYIMLQLTLTRTLMCIYTKKHIFNQFSCC